MPRRLRRVCLAVAAGLTLAPAPVGVARATDEVTVTRDLAYGQAPDETGVTETLLLDLYQPDDPAEIGTIRPAIVLVHGGGFDRGDKSDPIYAATAQAFADQGFVVASVNYRLRTDVYPDYPVAATDAQHDVQAAVRWLRANAAALRIDPARVAVAGHSAGAMIALRVATNPHDPGTSGTPGESSAVSAVVAVSGFLPVAVRSATARVLMLHGTADTLIPVGRAADTCQRWRGAGGACRLIPSPGGTHDATGFFDPADPLVADFLRCTIGGPVSFDDVPAGTAVSTAVGWAAGRGIVSSSDIGSFDPADPVTRLRLAAWTWKLLGRPSATDVNLADVSSNSPVAVSASWAVSTGVLAAADDGFDPSREMTRAEVAVALWQLAGRPSVTASGAVAGLDPSAAHAPAVEWLDAQGFDALLVGGVFRADAPARRLQAMRLLRGLSLEPDAWAERPAAPLCAG